jgi:hypothetical protein
VFLLGELVALVIYTLISRPMWFFLDEWDFLADRTGGNLGDLLRAHNEHWVALPVLVYRALWWLFGLRTYRPYQLVIVLLHLSAALLVWVVMRRIGVRPWTATVVASILVFFGSGYQNIVLPFQMTLVGSLVFGLLHLLLAGHEGPIDRRDYLGLAAGCAALMCSGVGVAMVIAVGVAVLISRGWRLALLHTMPLAAVYLAWYVALGNDGYTGYRAGVGNVARFVRLMITSTFSAMGHWRYGGVALAALLVVGLVVAWRPLSRQEFRKQSAAPLGLLVGAIALLGITGFGRAGLATFHEKSRYLHLVTAMVLPALAVAADAVMRRWRTLAPVVVVVLLIGIPGNVNVLVDYMDTPIVKNQARYRQMILSLPRVPAAKQVPRDVIPDQQFAHFVTIGWLLDGVASGRIPKPAHISAADEAMDALRLSFRQLRFNRAVPFDVCVPLTKPMVFRLDTNQRVTLATVSGTARLTPVSAQPGDTPPFLMITVAGPILEAVRAVDFRVTSVGPYPGRVCAAPALIRAARATSR